MPSGFAHRSSSVSHPGGIRERENYFAGVFIWVRIRTASEIEKKSQNLLFYVVRRKDN